MQKLTILIFLLTFSISETDPPIAPISAFAEFDISSGSFISYGSYMGGGFGLPMNLIRDLSNDALLYVIVPTSSQYNCNKLLQNNNVNMEIVVYLNYNHDTYWTKNFGPYFIVDGNNEIGIVDFQYDRPDRVNDNAIPLQLANHWNYNYFDSDIIHNGGNLMFNGINQAASSTLPYNANPNLDVNQMMFDYYGIEEYHTVEDPWNNYHEHIDCWAKFISPEKIIICQVPASHYRYAEIENVVTFYQNQENSFGEPYEIYRVYTPNGEAYANSYIMNGKVYVPVGFSQYDDEAIESYQLALPEYEVSGYQYGNFISTDALNCRVMNIPDFEAIQIYHNSINDMPAAMNEYEIIVKLNELTDYGINENSLKVYWKNQYMTEYTSIQLENFEDIYSANIPQQPGNTEVKYFIEAGNLNGRTDRLPIAGYFDFYAFGGPGFNLGDIDMDYLVNINDIFLIVHHVLNSNPITGYGLILADLNEDNTINVFDIIRIVNIILGN